MLWCGSVDTMAAGTGDAVVTALLCGGTETGWVQFTSTEPLLTAPNERFIGGVTETPWNVL